MSSATRYLPRPSKQATPADVCVWLRTILYDERYVQVFETEKIDGSVLWDLLEDEEGAEHLSKLIPFGPKHKLLKAWKNAPASCAATASHGVVNRAGPSPTIVPPPPSMPHPDDALVDSPPSSPEHVPRPPQHRREPSGAPPPPPPSNDVTAPSGKASDSATTSRSSYVACVPSTNKFSCKLVRSTNAKEDKLADKTTVYHIKVKDTEPTEGVEISYWCERTYADLYDFYNRVCILCLLLCGR